MVKAEMILFAHLNRVYMMKHLKMSQTRYWL